MLNPLVTVVLTVYQRTQFVKQALTSALGQTFTNYEILVADDSNSESIKAICETFPDERVIYSPNVQNLGVALSVRSAIQKARGKYIAILNDDDVWDPEFLQYTSTSLESNSDFALAFSDHWIIDTDGEILAQETDKNTALYGRDKLTEGRVPDLPHFVLVQNGVPLAMAALFRKNTLDLELLTIEVAGSYDFWISCLLAASGGGAYYVPKRLTRYRVHEASETARRAPDKAASSVYIYQTLLERRMLTEMTDTIQRSYSGSLFALGRDLLKFDKLAEARQFFKRSLQASQNRKARAGIVMSYFPKPMRAALLKSR